MSNLLGEYKELLQKLKSKGRHITPVQRKQITARLVTLESALTKQIMKQMLTGALILNLSKIPARLRAIVQRALNRRLHIIFMLHEIEKQAKKRQLEKSEEEKVTSIFYNLQQSKKNNVGNLTPLQRMDSKQNQESDVEKNNTKTHRRIKDS